MGSRRWRRALAAASNLAACNYNELNFWGMPSWPCIACRDKPEWSQRGGWAWQHMDRASLQLDGMPVRLSQHSQVSPKKRR